MKKQNTQKNTAKTLEAMKAELEAKQKRLEAYEQILESVESLIHSQMQPRIKTESWYEDVTDENGETKRKYHWAEYEEDEDGNTLYDEPTEDDWRYSKYIALCSARDEIMSLL